MNNYAQNWIRLGSLGFDPFNKVGLGLRLDIERREQLVEGVRRDAADEPSDHEILEQVEDLTNLGFRDEPSAVVSVYVQEEWVRRGDFDTHEPFESLTKSDVGLSLWMK